jgi:hypothetical protein
MREALIRHSSTGAGQLSMHLLVYRYVGQAVVDDASRMLLAYRAMRCMSRALPRCTSCNHLLERADVAARCGRPSHRRRAMMEAVCLDF